MTESDVLVTPVRSIATKFGREGRTRDRASSEMAWQLTRVRRSSRSHWARRQKRASVSSAPKKRKLRRRMKRA